MSSLEQCTINWTKISCSHWNSIKLQIYWNDAVGMYSQTTSVGQTKVPPLPRNRANIYWYMTSLDQSLSLFQVAGVLRPGIPNNWAQIIRLCLNWKCLKKANIIQFLFHNIIIFLATTTTTTTKMYIFSLEQCTKIYCHYYEIGMV